MNYLIYSNQLNSIIAISESKDIIKQYLSQFNLTEKDVEIFPDKYNYSNSNGSSQLLELSYISNNIVLTEMEYLFYKDYLCKLYEDMKTTISSLIVYSNIGLLDEPQKKELKSVSKYLYDKNGSYTTFLDNIDQSILFGQIIQNPIKIHHILLNHIDTMNRYNQLLSSED